MVLKNHVKLDDKNRLSDLARLLKEEVLEVKEANLRCALREAPSFFITNECAPSKRA